MDVNGFVYDKDGNMTNGGVVDNVTDYLEDNNMLVVNVEEG